jgi:hypothetical protein
MKSQLPPFAKKEEGARRLQCSKFIPIGALMKSIGLILASLFWFPALIGGSFAADNQPAVSQPPPPPPGPPPGFMGPHGMDPGALGAPPVIQKTGDGEFVIDTITLSKPAGTVSVKGEINMDQGLLEYLACGPAGKLHESLLKLDVNPYFFQIALLLIGLEPGDKPLAFQGAPGIPEGDPVEIWISWETPGKQAVKHRAEDLVLNIADNKTMPRTHWIFIGSQIIDGKFMAQMEQSIAATFHDPSAILDHPLTTGADDTLYHVNTSVVPARGTPVVFTVKKIDTHPDGGN